MARTADFYNQLLTSQYQNSTNLKLWLNAWVQKLVGSATCLESINPAFDVDTAVGIQLDIIGEIVGAKRIVEFIPTGIPTRSSTLTDDEFRVLIKATIGKNHWDGVIGSLNSLWHTIFGGDYIGLQDRQDMSLDVYFSTDLASIYKNLIQYGYIVPRPQGVLCNYYCGELPFVGFDYDNTFISGFDDGKWWVPCIPMYPVFGWNECNNLISGFDLGWWDSSEGVGFTDDWLDYLRSIRMNTVERIVTGYDSLSKAMRVNIVASITADESTGAISDIEIDSDEYGISGWYLYSIETTPGTPAADPNLQMEINNERNTEDKLSDSVKNISNSAGQTEYIWSTLHPIIDGIWTVSITGNTVPGAKMTVVFTFSQNA